MTEGESVRPQRPFESPAPRVDRGVCGILVTFRPDPGVLAEVVRAAFGQVDHLIVVDNDSGPASVAAIRHLLEGARSPGAPDVTPRFFDSNRGLPVRFNEAIRIARDAGNRYALFLDQDSILQPGAVERLLDAHGRLSGGIPLGALEARNEEPFTMPTDDFLSGYWRRQNPSLGDGLRDDFLGTNSGLFVPLEVFDRVGGFDESYFLDAVDFEFTLRLRSAGWRVLQVAGAKIRHQRGEVAAPTTTVRSPRIRRALPVRHYYVARDVLRTWRRYGRRFPLIGLFLLSMPIREAVLVLLFYKQRGAHLHYLALGTLDALRGVTGPIDSPRP